MCRACPIAPCCPAACARALAPSAVVPDATYSRLLLVKHKQQEHGAVSPSRAAGTASAHHTALALLSCCAYACARPVSALTCTALLCCATLTLSRPVHGIASVGIKGLPLPLARTAHRQPSTSSKRLLLPCFPPLSRRHHRQLTTASVLPHLHALEELPVEAYLTGPVTQHLFHRSSTAPLSHRRSRRCAAPARCHLLSVRTQAQDIVRQVRHRPWVIAKNTFSSAGRLGSRAKSFAWLHRRALAPVGRPHRSWAARTRPPDHYSGRPSGPFSTAS
jgi:hypothetical protein